MILRFQFGPKLFDRIHCWIDLSGERFFRFTKTRNNLVESNVANHQEIDVTRSLFLGSVPIPVEKLKAYSPEKAMK
jgi:hypothetical protein